MSRSTTPASLASSHTAVDKFEKNRSMELDGQLGKKDRRRSSVLSLITSSSQNSAAKQNGATPPGPPGPAGPPGPGGPNNLYQPGTLKFWLILVSNFLAMFLVALDRTIVATAIPQITDDFKSLGDIGWYVFSAPPFPPPGPTRTNIHQINKSIDRNHRYGSAYMLTTAASQLVFGRLYKFYHMKW